MTEPATIFEECLAVTFELEGNDRLSTDKGDPGNWTGGRVGVGRLLGTRWGISAAAFPNEDIAHLSRGRAGGLARDTFWGPARCAYMPASLALLVFDAAFQHGLARATDFLQAALGIREDGYFGAMTLSALRLSMTAPGAGRVRALGIVFQARRLLHMVAQPSWSRDAAGLAHRICVIASMAGQFSDDLPEIVG